MNIILSLWWLWLTLVAIGAILVVIDIVMVVLGHYYLTWPTVVGAAIAIIGFVPLSMISMRWFILFLISGGS